MIKSYQSGLLARARVDGGDGGGGINPQCIRIAAGDTHTISNQEEHK